MAKMLYLNSIIDFMLSWWSIVVVHSVFALLHRVYVGDIADVSEVPVPSIFMDFY
jgi:hypothetical protein